MGFSSLTRYDLFWESGNIIENGVEKNLTTYRKKNQLEEWHTCYRSTQKIKK